MNAAPVLEVDVIVVGAGSSGAVVARRLVDAGLEVALIEAGGPDQNPAIHDPQQVLSLAGGPEDWAYQTVPQRHLDGRRIPWARGKVLGGSSAINGMIHVRGHRADYDHWAYLGNYGWDYESVLPLFIRSEDHDGPDSEFHGKGGLWPVKTQYAPSPLHDAFVQAAEATGIPRNDDYNGPSIEGAALVQFSVDGETRATTAHSFLREIEDAPNFRVLTHAKAQRLLFEGDRCTGVEVDSAGQTIQVKANHEVVLSAGAVDSPRLLMLSGVASAAELRRLGLPVRVDLPGVGENLSDHLLVPMIYTINALPPQGPPGIPPQGSQLFWRSKQELFTPDLQPLVFSLPMYTDGLVGPDEAFTIAPGIIRPASRGRITLASADPAAEPLIDPNYFSQRVDMDAILAAVELCRDIAVSEPLATQWDAQELHPGREITDRGLLEKYIKDHVWSYWHPVGTCKMGVDAESVVDPELRVYGVEGLRIADASIMPAVPSGNTAAPCVMVGEKAAELVASALGASLIV